MEGARRRRDTSEHPMPQDVATRPLSAVSAKKFAHTGVPAPHEEVAARRQRQHVVAPARQRVHVLAHEPLDELRAQAGPHAGPGLLLEVELLLREREGKVREC